MNNVDPQYLMDEEKKEMVAEVQRTQPATKKGIVAYIPTGIEGADDGENRKQCLQQLIKRSAQIGMSVTQVCDKIPMEDAVVINDGMGHKSVWAAHHNEQHKFAYMQFWWSHKDLLGRLDWLDGTQIHIDHSFNKARMLVHRAGVQNRGAVLDDEISVNELCYSNTNHHKYGYARLFALPATINTEYGRTIEKQKTQERRERGLFAAASWVILAKVAKLPPPITMEDVETITSSLVKLYGMCGYADLDSVCRSVANDFRMVDMCLIQTSTISGTRNCWARFDQIAEDEYLRVNLEEMLRVGCIVPLWTTAWNDP